jgi:hypothetical protein
MLDGFFEHLDEFFFAGLREVDVFVLLLSNDVVRFQIEGSREVPVESLEFRSVSSQLAGEFEVLGRKVLGVGFASSHSLFQTSLKFGHQRVKLCLAQREIVLSLREAALQIGAVHDDKQIARSNVVSLGHVDTLNDARLGLADREAVRVDNSVRLVAEDSVPHDVNSGEKDPH